VIFIAGTMGVGKTATAQALKKMLPASVLLDWIGAGHETVCCQRTDQGDVQDNIVHC
jgi:broad-specificity NMP kinase